MNTNWREIIVKKENSYKSNEICSPLDDIVIEKEIWERNGKKRRRKKKLELNDIVVHGWIISENPLNFREFYIFYIWPLQA